MMQQGLYGFLKYHWLVLALKIYANMYGSFGCCAYPYTKLAARQTSALTPNV